MNSRRVVVTGMGAISPIGDGAKENWENAKKGVNGVGPITRFDPELFRTKFACEVVDFDPASRLDRNEMRKTDLFTRYAIYAADQAREDSGFDFEGMNPFDVGVIWGSGQGGMTTFEEEVKAYVASERGPRFNPFFIPKLIVNMASGMISMKYGFMGINYTAVSACATSNTAIMDAYNYIKWGKAKIMITGGSEAGITEASVGGFTAMKAMSMQNDDPQTASQPFDVKRNGFVMGEGAAALVLEDYEHAKARGAKIYAEIAGAAMTADAYHMTATHPEGKGAHEAMRQALEEAGLTMHDVDYINTHGTSTPVGDLSEIRAIHKHLGDGPNKVQVSASKSMTGHLLGAAGGIEAILCIGAINDNIVPPTINTTELDPEIPKNINIVLKEALAVEVNVALSNTFGFGGHNATIVFKQFVD